MDRRTFSLSAIGAVVGTLTACGGGGGGTATQGATNNPVPSKDSSVVAQPLAPSVELASATLLPAGTVFLQSVAATDREAEAAPGQANFWDLRRNLALGDGYNNQFVGALNLSVNLVGSNVAQPFPSDQLYPELEAYGPELGADDGVKAVSFIPEVNGGPPAFAHLHPSRGAKLQQTLDLTGAAGSIALSWSSFVNAAAWAVNDAFSDEPFSWQVVLYDSAGNLRETFYRIDQASPVGTGTDGSANLDNYAGQSVVLSFEHDSPAEGAQVSMVSVISSGREYVNNGNFASGASGWTVPAIKVSQNVQSARRTLHDLNVRRMFYAQPDALWGRWTDCFENPTPNSITVTVSYDSTLGSDGRGVIYFTPGANDKALTSWDSGGSGLGGNDRDIGMVFGSGVTKTARPATASTNGSPNINFMHTISVPAGGSVALVNFIIMTGTDTGLTAAGDFNARATEVDTLAADIANNFRTNLAYQRGMMQAHLDTLKNF